MTAQTMPDRQSQLPPHWEGAVGLVDRWAAERGNRILCSPARRPRGSQPALQTSLVDPGLFVWYTVPRSELLIGGSWFKVQRLPPQRPNNYFQNRKIEITFSLMEVLFMNIFWLHQNTLFGR
jgi:hypothetical protein